MKGEVPRVCIDYSFGAHSDHNTSELINLEQRLRGFFRPDARNIYFREDVAIPSEGKRLMDCSAESPSFYNTFLNAIAQLNSKSGDFEKERQEAEAKMMSEPELVFAREEMLMIDRLKQLFPIAVEQEDTSDKRGYKLREDRKIYSRKRADAKRLLIAKKLPAALGQELIAVTALAGNVRERNKKYRYVINALVADTMAKPTLPDLRLAIRVGSTHDALFDQTLVANAKYGDEVIVTRAYDSGITDIEKVRRYADSLMKKFELNPSYKPTQMELMRSLADSVLDDVLMDQGLSRIERRQIVVDQIANASEDFLLTILNAK